MSSPAAHESAMPSTLADQSSGTSLSTLKEKTTSSNDKNLPSPNIQEKIDVFSKNFEKRKSESSQEQQSLSRKEKKRIKEMARSQKKREDWEKKQVV